MTRWMARWGAAGIVLGLIAGCRPETLARAPVPVRVPGPVAPALLGLELGAGKALPFCTGQDPAQPCLLRAEDSPADAGLYTLQQLPGRAVGGLHADAVALQLADGLESVSVQFEGADALQALPQLLEQQCGPAGFDSRMELEGGGHLRSMSWQCPDAVVQLNALDHPGQAQGALSLTTARGQAWFDGAAPLPGTAIALE